MLAAHRYKNATASCYQVILTCSWMHEINRFSDYAYSLLRVKACCVQCASNAFSVQASVGSNRTRDHIFLILYEWRKFLRDIMSFK